MTQDAWVEFCGERFTLDAAAPFTVGREGDLVVDDNPYLHRRFLVIECRDGVWWLGNHGSQLTATVADGTGSVQAWLAPGAGLPLVFAQVVVLFTAGPTTYEFEVHTGAQAWAPVLPEVPVGGDTTMGRVSLTPDQRLLIVALCEPVLTRHGSGAGSVPSSADAARRLGWTLTKFNRKLDNVCQKLARDGVRGLHGGPEQLATNRRARLVEHALATRTVTVEDVRLLSDTSGIVRTTPTV